MGVEFEIKLHATQESCDKIQRDKDLPWQRITMETTYYDTQDGALSARRWTLRRRLENGVSVCTLKTPAADGSRGEWEVEEASIEKAIQELCKLSDCQKLAVLTSRGVEAVCGARFTRQAAQLQLEDAVLELALDLGILFGGSREQAFCEVEVELKSGSCETVTAFAAALAREYELEPERKSKFARALALKEESRWS